MTLLDLFKTIRTFIFDIDGVLTNGYVWPAESGEMLRQMNIRDGYALQLAVKMGYRVAVISGGSSETVRVRLERLGITDIYLITRNKTEKLKEYIEQHQLNAAEILFMGDDIPDYMAMQLTGLPCAPADAAPEIKKIARYISPKKGGDGCARDVIEKVLKLNDHWPLDTNLVAG